MVVNPISGCVSTTKIQSSTNKKYLHAKPNNRGTLSCRKMWGGKSWTSGWRWYICFPAVYYRPSAGSADWACWVKKKLTCFFTEWEVTLNALALDGRVKAGCKLVEAKSILLWLSHWEKGRSHPEVRDGFASLNSSPRGCRAGARAVNFGRCSACPAAGSPPPPPRALPTCSALSPEHVQWLWKKSAISFSFSLWFCSLFGVQQWGKGQEATFFLDARSRPFRGAQGNNKYQIPSAQQSGSETQPGYCHFTPLWV